jgi:hypothetical protein
MNSLVDKIRSCEYLYLETLTEPSVNAIRILLLEAAAGRPVDADTLASVHDPVVRSILAGSRRIEPMPGCRRFELVWETYIGYSVVNESYSNGEPNTSIAVGERRRFAEYASSQYLDYMTQASFASKDYPGPYRHWALYCQDHTIDIASQVDPVIREIGPAPPSTDQDHR